MNPISFPLQDMFPRASYPPENKALLAHYLISLGQPVGTIEKVLSKPSAILDFQDPEYLLTPLAVSVLARNKDLVQWLLERGANPFPKDRIGWTPLHYAEILNDEEIKKPLIACAKKTKGCVIPSLFELKKVLSLESQPEEISGAKIFDPSKNSWSPLTTQKFSNLSGAFCSEVTAEKQGLMGYWLTSSRSTPRKVSITNFLTQSFFKQRGFPLLMGVIPQRKGPYQIITREKISVFTGVLGVYGGEINCIHEYSPFQLGPINSKRFSNLFSLIPDGMPNCYADELLIDGIPYFPVLALEEIPIETPLYVDYGPRHPIKMRYRPIPKETIAYYETFCLSHAVDEIKTLFTEDSDFSIQKYAYFQKLWARFSYLLDTPFLLIELLYLGKINPETVIQTVQEKVLNTTRDSGLPFEKVFRYWRRNELILNAWRTLKEHPLSRFILEESYPFIKKIHIETATCFLVQLESRLEEIQTEDDFKAIFAELISNSQAYEVYLNWLNNSDAERETDLFKEAEVALESVNKRDLNLFLETTFKLIMLRGPSVKVLNFLNLAAWVSVKRWAEAPGTEESAKYEKYLETLNVEELTGFHQAYRERFKHLIKRKYPEKLSTWLNRFDVLFLDYLPRLYNKEFTLPPSANGL